MKKKFRHLNLIDDYFFGQLSERQRALLLDKIKSNKHFVHEFEEFKSILTFLKDKETIGLREQLNAIVNKKTSQSFSKSTVKLFVFQSISYAALLLVLISVNVLINYAFLNKLPRVNDYSIEGSFDSNRLFEDSLIVEFENSLPKVTADCSIYLQKESIGENKTPSTNLPNKKLISLEPSKKNYIISSVFSELLLSNLRSESLRVIEPLDSSIFLYEDTISFIWKANQNSGLFLEVLNNNGQLVFELALDSLDTIKLINQYKAGAYIVKFRTESEILDIRMFFVY